MFRWFRNFGVFLRKPRGAARNSLQSERRTRSESSVTDGYRSSSYESCVSRTSGTTRSSVTTRSSEPTRSSCGKSTRSSEPTTTRSSCGKSTKSARSQSRYRSPSPNPSRQPRERGRDRTQRNNINAQSTVLSPTNRSGKLDRSRSKSHETNFLDRMKNANHDVWNEKIPKGTHVIYTDGSYLKWEGKSGIGIFMGPDHPLNRSQKIRGAIQNNQYAEFLAVKTALENLRNWEGYHENDPVIVRTDNRNVIVALKNRDFSQFSGIAKDILDICEELSKVEFQHVYAHEGDPGNEMADVFAGMGSSKRDPWYAGCHRSSETRERNRKRSKSNDPEFIRDNSLAVETRHSL